MGRPHERLDLLRITQIALEVDLTRNLQVFEAAMVDLDAEVRSILSVIPTGKCILVTGHDSLGYFADRFGCPVVGAIIPSLSSTAEASARDLAELHAVAEATGVRAIFTEGGTPPQVAAQIAADLGIPLVELASHGLPGSGGYQAFIIDLATTIAAALGPASGATP